MTYVVNNRNRWITKDVNKVWKMYQEGSTDKEIAETLGRTEGSVGFRIYGLIKKHKAPAKNLKLVPGPTIRSPLGRKVVPAVISLSLDERIDEMKTQLAHLEEEAEAAKKPTWWVPEAAKGYYYTDVNGNLELERKGIRDVAIHSGNYFADFDVCERVAAAIKTQMQIAKACVSVEPDFIPNWNDDDQEKWSVFWDIDMNNWDTFNSVGQLDSCMFISTQIKAEQVVTLLKNRNITPPGVSYE